MKEINDISRSTGHPIGAAVYHGFAVLDIAVEGFRLGMISDFNADPLVGDAFVIAPDGSRAGLVWEVGEETQRFEKVWEMNSDRWGVWAVWVSEPMNDPESQRRNLASILPNLKEQWQLWRKRYA